MTQVILYRYHEGVDHHVERLRILRHFNPEVAIHGVYGGRDFASSERALSDLFDSLIAHPNQDSDWKWRMNDLVVRDWYIRTGHRLRFDRIYDHEFDLLFTHAHDHVYPAMSERTLALTHLFRLADYEQSWYWTQDPNLRPQIERFFHYMAQTFGMGYPQFGCMWAGAAMPKSFLDDFARLDLDDSKLLVCELTTPCLAEMLGYDMIDNGLVPNLSKQLPAYLLSPGFHADSSRPVRIDEIKREFKRNRGRPNRAAFHPVKGIVTLEDILEAQAR